MVARRARGTPQWYFRQMRRIARVGISAAIMLVITACTAPSASPQASPTESASTSQAGEPTPTATSAPVDSPEPSPGPSVGPATVAGEVGFGNSWFGGMSMGRHPTDYASTLG